MKINKLYSHKLISGKHVYIVDDHHKVLSAWAIERRKLANCPNLLTLDHHTDIHEAFLGHACIQSNQNQGLDSVKLKNDLQTQIEWANDDSLLNAISLLRHDEHIHAATFSGVIGSAFCIQLSDRSGTLSIEQVAQDNQQNQSLMPWRSMWPPPQRPWTYSVRTDRIYVIPHDCVIDCKKRPHDDECHRDHSSQVIESSYLDDQLLRGAEIAACLGMKGIEAAPYILDIDLDVFHTKMAIEPRNSSTFHRLIRNAVAITIATEALCVEELWLDESNQMRAEDLLVRVLQHIEDALK